MELEWGPSGVWCGPRDRRRGSGDGPRSAGRAYGVGAQCSGRGRQIDAADKSLAD